MAVLKNNVTGEKTVLRSHHVFGRRKAKVDTFIDRRDVSQIHASIRWDGSSWKIQDHSKNGTWLDGKPISPGNNAVLEKGSSVRFGASDSSNWTVIDLGAPSAILAPIHDDKAILALNNVHVLPSEDRPEISLFISEAGRWKIEKDGINSTLSDGDLIDDGSTQWQFFDAGIVDATLEQGFAKNISLDDIFLIFNVSLDEEHVKLDLVRGGAVVSLGERIHHYLLLTLARQRRDDVYSNVDEDNQGWLDLERLSSMIGLDPNHINIQIFRLRKQFAETLADLHCLPQIIERRVGGVRIAARFFKIIKGAGIECELIKDNSIETAAM